MSTLTVSPALLSHLTNESLASGSLRRGGGVGGGEIFEPCVFLVGGAGRIISEIKDKLV